MASGELYGGSNSNITVLLQNQTLLPYSSDSELLDSVCFQTSHPSFQGSKSLVNFERHFKEEKGDDDEDLEACFHQPGSKKRRLTSEQVQFLERNFEVENKLEPERKVQLAKELGLQPRQVAIWFQNRRARFKAKQLEKDYATLKSSYDTLKCDHDNLLQENQKLKEEVYSLKNTLIPREREKEKGYEKENLDEYKSSDAVNSQHNATPQNGSSKVALPVTVMCKQEDVNSAKSDVVDSDSTYYHNDGNHSSPLVEPADSDFSSEDDEGGDNLSQNLLTLQPRLLPKIEDGCTYDDPPEKSCNFGFPFGDQTFCFWPC